METTFVKSPLYDNWLFRNKPEKSLLICSPFFKNEALEKIIDRYKLSDENSEIEINVLIRGKLVDFIQGSSDISALESLIQLKSVNVDNVRRLTNLHMKAYLIDDKKILIGSGNFTTNGLFARRNVGNVEGAIATDDENIITDFKEYYLSIISESESLDIFYDMITDSYAKYVDEFSSNIGCEISTLISKSEKKIKYKFTDRANDLSHTGYSGEISTDTIPQFSNFEDGAYRVVEILTRESNRGLTFDELGQYLQGSGKNIVAYKKYGENHAKLAELLDFVTITHTKPRKVILTKLGRFFNKSDSLKKIEILKSQIYRMAIIKDIIIKHTNESFDFMEYLNMYLAKTTAKRRAPNIRTLFGFLRNYNVNEVESVIKKLY